jgi:hypothetical protein
VVRDLLTKLHDKLDVLDWQSRQQTRVDVQSTIEFMLDELPREPYPEAMWHASGRGMDIDLQPGSAETCGL